jgi:hypothetical protein
MDTATSLRKMFDRFDSDARFHADIVLVAAHVFGKDEAMVRFHLLAPIHAPQALLAMQRFCTPRNSVRLAGEAPSL